MDVREKLVELQVNAFNSDNISRSQLERIEFTTDFLLANNVTIQEWHPVSEPPQEDERVIVWLGKNRYNDVKIDTDRIHNGKWVRWGDCVTHWAPICLSEPQMPKLPSGLCSGGQDDGC